jgi:hypothetical protein
MESWKQNFISSSDMIRTTKHLHEALYWRTWDNLKSQNKWVRAHNLVTKFVMLTILSNTTLATLHNLQIMKVFQSNRLWRNSGVATYQHARAHAPFVRTADRSYKLFWSNSQELIPGCYCIQLKAFASGADELYGRTKQRASKPGTIKNQYEPKKIKKSITICKGWSLIILLESS